MSLPSHPNSPAEVADFLQWVDEVAVQFETAWQSQPLPRIPDYLGSATGMRRKALLEELVRIDMECRCRAGEMRPPEDYLQEFPELADAQLSWEQISTAIRPQPPSTQDTPADGAQSVSDGTPQKSPTVAGYEMMGELGRGGMGVVYKAKQKSLGRVVALKMVRHGMHASPEDIARFRAEAEAVARLQHPNIVQIFDIGQHDGQPFLSLEFMEGGSLDRKLAGKPLPPREAAQLVGTLARAVHSAHGRSIVHRDLKPGNVLLTADGLPKISDFGLAKRLDSESGQTGSVAFLGTPSYMAPEQANGRARDVGAWTDVYALGAILYELLTGRPPFKEETPLQTAQKVISTDPMSPSRIVSKVHRDLETICLKALSKEPSRRYRSALALAEDLARFDAGEPILARREGLLRKAWRRVRRHPVAVMSMVIGVLALIAVGIAIVELRARKINELKFAIDLENSALPHREFDEQRTQTIERIIRELETAGGGRADCDVKRRQLQSAVAECVRNALKKSRIDDRTDSTVESALQWLTPRDPQLAGDLRIEFDDRRTRWDSIFDLSGYDIPQVDAIFSPDSVLPANPASRFVPGNAAPTEVSAAALIPRHDDLRVGHSAEPSQTVVLTKSPSDGNVELRAVFESPSWRKASHLGLLLDAKGGEGGEGYSFIVQASRRASRATQDVTFANAGQQGGVVRIQILRNGKVLREREVDSEEIGEKSLSIAAKRDGLQLTFRVNEHVVAFEDLFLTRTHPPGVFGLYWPPNVRLTGLRAMRPKLSANASRLERGDRLYVDGKYSDALDHYGAEGSAHGKTELGQEARCKEGLCLLRLREDGKAAEVLAPLAEETGARWPKLARTLLWVALMRINDTDSLKQADWQLEVLLRSASLKDVITLLPREVLEDMWQIVLRNYGGLNVVLFDLTHLRRLERMVEAIEQLDFRPRERGLIRITLSFAYRWRRDPHSAIAALEDLLRHEDEVASLNEMNLPPVREYCWLLRETGQAAKALEVVDRYLLDASGNYREENLGLLLERARARVALNQSAQAEEDLSEFAKRVPLEKMTYPLFSSAALMHGFLRQDRGDIQGAIEAWRQGLYKNYRGRRTIVDGPAAAIEASASIFNGMLLASLCNELSDQEAVELTSLVLPYSSQFFFPFGRGDLPWLRTSIWREAWQSSAAIAEARKIVFQQLPLFDWVRTPFTRYSAGMMRYAAFPKTAEGGGTSAEQEEVLRQLAWRVFEHYFTGKAPREKLVAHTTFLYAAWDRPGSSPVSLPVIWKRVRGEVDPSIRAPLAYVLGRRCVVARLFETADFFFRAALEDAPVDSPLGRLAQEEIDRLGMK